MTDATLNPIEAAIAREPRLQAITDDSIRMTMAGLMIGLGVTFEAAESQVLGLISNASAHKAAVEERVKAKQAEVEKTFYEAFHDLLLDAVKGMPKSDLPMGGIVIRVDPDTEYKNSDGSPMMDSANNPVRGPLVNFQYGWKSSGTRTVGNTSNMGRPEGDYVIEGEAEPYKSMAQFARAKWGTEYDNYSKESGSSARKFLTSKGYSVPEAPIEDADGKKHWTITKAAQTAAA